MASFSGIKATNRGFGFCGNATCKRRYPNSHKPEFCVCGHYLGGKSKACSKKKKIDAPPVSVQVFNVDSRNFRSVRTTSRDNRVFVLDNNDRSERLCYDKNCKDVRASFVISGKVEEFTCKHLDATFVEPIYSIDHFADNDIDCCTPDEHMRASMKHIQAQIPELPTVVKISEKNFAVKGVISSNDPVGYVHVMVNNDSMRLDCLAEPCRKVKVRTKQVRNCTAQERLYPS